MSFSEISCFLEIITLLIGDYVPSNEKSWHLILQLREIHYIIFSPQFQIEICDYLKTLIDEYLSLLKELNFHMRPKHHYLIHYPRLMKKMGPLQKLSSLRYESKHRVNKVIANATTSRRNICKTIAYKNQLIFNERCLMSKAEYCIFEFGPLGTYTFYQFGDNTEELAPMKHLSFLDKCLKADQNVLMRPCNDGDIELLSIENISGNEFNKKIIISCKRLNFCHDPHHDSLKIVNKLNANIFLDNYDLFECIITYKIFLNGAGHVLKRWS